MESNPAKETGGEIKAKQEEEKQSYKEDGKEKAADG
jgi:hypothetical protein